MAAKRPSRPSSAASVRTGTRAGKAPAKSSGQDTRQGGEHSSRSRG